MHLFAGAYFLTLFPAPLCHIDFSVSAEGKIIDANSPASAKPTNKTCLIHQADAAIKTTLPPSAPAPPPLLLSRCSRSASPLSLSPLGPPALPPLHPCTCVCVLLLLSSPFSCKNSLTVIVEGAPRPLYLWNKAFRF